ncbi:MAG: nickel pincer cofactor biosynthesis protein LarB [Candidatus Zixiibacteriota bacterium]
MNQSELIAVLERVENGEISAGEAQLQLKSLPFMALGQLRIDTHRELRTGQPEVIYSPGKTPSELADAVRTLNQSGQDALLTRLLAKEADDLGAEFPRFHYYEKARAGVGYTREDLSPQKSGSGEVAVISAGASDATVAEEAALTARIMGAECEIHSDVGVAGIHRLQGVLPRVRDADCLIVVAGMDGALLSVVGGLVETPVIGVPTSVGYGASFEGLAALLSMLNSCASGVAVVNIDNGFGAGALAARIGRRMVRARQSSGAQAPGSPVSLESVAPDASQVSE